MIGSFILSYDSSVMRFRPWIWHVDRKCQDDKTFFSTIHPCPGFKLTVCFCVLSIQIKERTVKRSKLFGESSHLLNFTLSVSL